MQTPSVAIVILNWNGKEFLEKFLPSVVGSVYADPPVGPGGQDAHRALRDLHKKIIVADNASTDNSIQFLQENYPQVSIIQNSSNEGFAKGYNTALKQVKAEYYVLLNSDVGI
jgi:GT2 family glycosyltransferase